MQIPSFFALPASFVLIASSPAWAADYSIGNSHVTRTLSDDGGHLKTLSIDNHESGKTLGITDEGEFSITFSIVGKATTLTSADFTTASSTDLSADGVSGREFTLTAKGQPVVIKLRYWVKPEEAFMRKALTLTANTDITLQRVQIESLGTADGYTVYKPTAILARGAAKWTPPLGQPIYTHESAIWFGTEFPAARNEAKAGNLSCAYLTRTELTKGETWTSHPAVMGVADDSRFLKDAFFSYIDTIRARPLRLQTQYNSWFDFGTSVDAGKFVSSVSKIHDELMVKRGVPPLSAYVIDDGWQDAKVDWSKTGVWPVNGKFDSNFKACRAATTAADSQLGLWVSPGSLFNATPAVGAMKKAGWRALDPWMSLIGDEYMKSLHDRLVSLAGSPVAYFKLDGLFGHLNTRNFDIEGFKGGEKELNDSKYDEAKERYLSLGTERLMEIFKDMGRANPDVYITISNGAYLSPWWLQGIDAVWMINAGDAAGGADRTAELTYRDGVYHQLFAVDRDNTQFPTHSLFNHEPKKTSTGEDADTFRRYLYMNLSRGTGFVELYLKTQTLSGSDWDVLAEGLKWVHQAFPAFKRSRMIGGDPTKGEVYGFTGWDDKQGYLSLHNPSGKQQSFKVTFNRELGLPKSAVTGKASYAIRSPLEGDADSLAKEVATNGQLTIDLPPKAIRILDFKRLE